VRGRVVAALVGAVFVLGGCQYLLGLRAYPPLPSEFGSFDPGEFGSFDPGPEFSLPPPLATYSSGSASVEIGGTTTSLDRLVGPARLYQEFGTEVLWTDGKGLYFHYYGMVEPGGPGGPGDDGFVTLDRIFGGQHWSSADPGVCTVKVTQSDAKGLAGTATCKAVRWIDAMASFNGGLQPAYVEGQAPFDAEITFEAAP
jgi:hypothetical protein